MKVHKNPIATCPIVSCSGSLLHSLGIWDDTQLQKIVPSQHSYIKNSLQVKTELLQLEIPPDSTLFTVDAYSMYTNIDTEAALTSISMYLRKHEDRFTSVPIEAVEEALWIVMTNNIFTFGDTTFLQLQGTTMGTPPAPSYATLYFAIFEDVLLKEFPQLFYYPRFIDDIVAVWTPGPTINNNTAWTHFNTILNSFHQLQGKVQDRCHQVEFLDLTISLY